MYSLTFYLNGFAVCLYDFRSQPLLADNELSIRVKVQPGGNVILNFHPYRLIHKSLALISKSLALIHMLTLGLDTQVFEKQ